MAGGHWPEQPKSEQLCTPLALSVLFLSPVGSSNVTYSGNRDVG